MQKKKTKKGPLSHQKIKCSFLDYVQLLMIGQAIWVTNVDWNTKKNERRPPMSLKNKILIFGLRSTSDDWPSDLSNECQLKCKNMEKGPPVSLKNKIFVFGLCSTSDDRPSNLSDKRQMKHKKKTKEGPICCQKIKSSFLDYIQLLMINWVIWAMNIDQNAKK